MAKMTKAKWRSFRLWFATFAVLAVWFLWGQGVFDEPSLVVSAIVGFALAAVAVASYFYWKSQPDDLE